MPQENLYQTAYKDARKPTLNSSYSLLCYAAGYQGGHLDDASYLTMAAHIMMLTLFISIHRLHMHLRYSTWVDKQLKETKARSRQQKQDLFTQQRDRVKELGGACFCSVPCLLL